MSDVKRKIITILGVTFVCSILTFGVLQLISKCHEHEFEKGDRVKLKSTPEESPCNCVVDHIFCEDVQVLCTDDYNKTTEITVHHSNLEICN